MADAERPRTPRRRDPEGHRATILEATRASLAEHGYARATIRDIARRAGVTHGLVMRHFGSKEQLMVAALPSPWALDDVLAGDPRTLPERVAQGYVSQMEAAAPDSPLVAIIRSAATNEAAAGAMWVELRRRISSRLAQMLALDDLEVRADLVSSVLIGVTFERYIMGRGTISQLAPEALEAYIAGLVRHILEPALAAP